MDIEVVKVSNDRPAARPKRHGNSPSLYLELVENKERVRQDLVNKEYVPPAEPEVSLSDLEDDVPIPEASEGEENDDAQSADASHEPHEASADADEAPRPPALSEIGGHQKRYYRDIARVTTDEISEAEEKRQLLFKFEMLKKKYKESAGLVPEYTVMSDLAMMRRSYDDTVQRVVLDATVEDYKSYFRTACWGIEWALNHFGFDITGFTTDQMSKMNTYERLLIELCEKHYNPEGSSIPVELRLLGMILMNAAAFVAMRLLAKKFSPPPVAVAQPEFEVRKMRGPRPLDEAQLV